MSKFRVKVYLNNNQTQIALARTIRLSEDIELSRAILPMLNYILLIIGSQSSMFRSHPKGDRVHIADDYAQTILLVNRPIDSEMLLEIQRWVDLLTPVLISTLRYKK